MGIPPNHNKENIIMTHINANIAPDDAIDFEDDDVGYEQVANALKTIGFDWKKASTLGYAANVCVVVGDKLTKPQLCFDLEPNQPMLNGQPPIAFGVYAGVYDGIKQTVQQIRAMSGHEDDTMISCLCLDGHHLLLTIG